MNGKIRDYFRTSVNLAAHPDLIRISKARVLLENEVLSCKSTLQRLLFLLAKFIRSVKVRVNNAFNYQVLQ